MGMLMAAMRPQAFAGLVLNDIGPELDPAGATRIAVVRRPTAAGAELERRGRAGEDRCSGTRCPTTTTRAGASSQR